VLVAAAFPRIVMHTSVWLSEVGLDVSLVQVALWRSADDLVCSFERLYPVPAVEEFTLAPARQQVAAAKERAAEKSRRARTIHRIIESGLLEVGAPLTLAATSRVTAEEKSRIAAWVEQDPARGRTTFNGDPAAGLLWEADGQPWTPTGLSKHIAEDATGRRPDVIGGPRWCTTADGVSLRELADSAAASGGKFDWARLHRILDAMPAGRWTTYADVTDVIGTGPVALGTHILRCAECRNGYRVLGSNGRIPDGFRWGDSSRADDPAQLLEGEGVRMSGGRADETQRLMVAELNALAQ
jgi:alkylated DNA nucleotide flippase Atl1